MRFVKELKSMLPVKEKWPVGCSLATGPDLPVAPVGTKVGCFKMALQD